MTAYLGAGEAALPLPKGERSTAKRAGEGESWKNESVAPSPCPLPGGERKSASSPSRSEIVAAARGWIGTPYRHQGALKGVGCDCLGLLIGVWREIGGEGVDAIPPYTPDWAEAGGRETFAEGLRTRLIEIEPRDAAAGDAVLFRWRRHLPAKHAGILTAPDRMVHAQERAAVAEVALSGWWKRRVAYAFSFSP